MIQVVETLRHLSTLQANSIPSLDLPAVAECTSLPDLAQAMGAADEDLNRLTSTLGTLRTDRQLVTSVAEQANAAITRATHDLLSIAMEFLAHSMTLLSGLLNPVTSPAATAQLNASATQALNEGHLRVENLQAELAPMGNQLLEIPAEQQENAPPPPPEESSTEEGSSVGQAAVEAALSQLGTPYVWGGTGNGGFDCSGLVQWAYAQAGVDLPRTADQQAVGRQVDASELQPGDLAVWSGHVAMYIGDGMMVEAGDPVQTNPVRTSNIGMPFKGFWRPTG